MNIIDTIENLVNGNISTARKSAKRFSLDKIIQVCQDDFLWTYERASRAAIYLKTGEGWQSYCDAK